jgi:glutamyl-tRNA synthetase
VAELRGELAKLPSWTPAAIGGAFEAVLARHPEVPLGKLAQAVRVAVTGTASSPGIHETVAALARERALERLDDALASWPAGG